jgi:phosphoribosylglycinamide formyltransferase 2
VVPEIEAIHTPTLSNWKAGPARDPDRARGVADHGPRRHPPAGGGNARLPTSPFRFVDDEAAFRAAIAEVGLPCVVKPVMSSPATARAPCAARRTSRPAWEFAQSGGRAGKGRVIVEGFIDFEYEITQLTVRHRDGTSFCDPIGHLQKDGDYRESWMPQPMSAKALARSQEIARAVTDNLGGYGIFGVELFVRGDEVWFSEVSPRPHDTGLVTLAGQELSQFALHARAILGLPIPKSAPGARRPPARCSRTAAACPRSAAWRQHWPSPARCCACSASPGWKATAALP